MEKFDFNGLGVAMITPFKEDNSIDFESLDKIIDHLLIGGVDYIVVLGTTGESATLTMEERKKVKEFVRKKTAGNVPLVLGYGGINTSELVRGLRTLDLDGFSAILSVAPFYVKPNQEGLYRHYREIAENSPLPVILYNVPGRTGCNLEAETTLRLANDCPNIIAIKEASGRIEQIEEILAKKPTGFKVISGDDSLACPLIFSGASGVISVFGNAYPKEFGDMVHDALEGRNKEAEEKHLRFLPIIKTLFEDGNPGGIKNLMALKGLCEEHLRLPLVAVGQSTATKIKKEKIELEK